MNVNLIALASLLAAFQLKHWLADYRFQTPFMLGKFKPQGWEKPLVVHAAVHALGTLWIGGCFIALRASATGRVASKWMLLTIPADFAVHFAVDRIKVLAGRDLTPAEPRFWRQLGLDQMAHHLTHYAIIAALLVS